MYDKVLGNKRKKVVLAKPVGDNSVKTQVAVEKFEKKPKELKFGGGVNKVRSMLSPLDMVEPSNLGLSLRDMGAIEFNKDGVKMEGLIAPKLDDLTMGELVKGRKGDMKFMVLRKGPRVHPAEKILANLNPQKSFCGYCESRCQGTAQSQVIGSNVDHYV